MGSIFEQSVVTEGDTQADDKMKSDRERASLKSLEWPLQIGWLSYRMQCLSEADISSLAEKIAEKEFSENRRAYILHGSLDVKRDVVMTDIIDPDGALAEHIGIERQWFRSEAEKDPLDQRFMEALVLIGGGEEERAWKQLDAYFMESIQKH